MFDLRQYQKDAKDLLKESFAKGNKRVVMEMPTGAGKTVTFVDMVVNAISRGKKANIICDRKELIGQAYDKVKEMGISPTVISPGYRQTPNNIYLSSVDTLRRRDLPDVDMVIIDEAHKQTFDKTITRYIDQCDPFIIGATATPLRTGNQNSLSDYYQDMVSPVTTQDLIDMGFLVNARHFSTLGDFDDVKTRGSDYDMGALYQKFNQTKLYDGVIDNYIKHSKGRKAICFNVNVAHSTQMVQNFRDNGIEAVHLDGNTPTAERRRILRDYKTQNFILSNCSVLTTGFDEPSIETVIVNRATLSLPLWLQMTGRGSRTFSGKDNFIILDQGANTHKHGMWEDVRTWSLDKKPKGKSDGVAPVRVCEQCDIINSASARVCKECGHVFPVKEKKIEKVDLVEIKKNRGLIKKVDPKTCTRQELSDYAKAMGYKQGWVYNQLKLVGRM